MKLSKLEVAFLTFALFSTVFFFGFNILTGRVYAGADADNSFVSYMMVVDIIPLLLFIRLLFSNKSKSKVGPIVLFLLVILVLFLIGGGLNNINVKTYIAYSLPSALIGIIIAKYNGGEQFAKYLEPLMLFLTIVGIRSMSLILAVSYRGIAEEGIGAQSLSYHCGFAFALNLYFLLFGDELKDRFKYAKTSIYKYLSVILLVIQFAITISSGGRGGFVLVTISAITLVFMRILKRKTSSSSLVFIFTLLLIVVVLAVKFMPENIIAAMDEGSGRTFSYITKSGIDMSKTSNRDATYHKALDAIGRSPIIGYGLLMKGSGFEGDYPHNIFLEILLQGGVLYFTFFMFFIIHLFKKLRSLVKCGHGLFIVPVALYPIVMLCFSGSYLGTNLFWFIITYIICCEVPKKPSPVNT